MSKKLKELKLLLIKSYLKINKNVVGKEIGIPCHTKATKDTKYNDIQDELKQRLENENSTKTQTK